MRKSTKVPKAKGLSVPVLYFIYLFLAWSFYRINFKCPDWLEEVVIKPEIWLTPLLFLIPQERVKLSELGITIKNIFPSIYLSIALGVGFALLGVIANIAKYQGINFQANTGGIFLGYSLGLSLATAFTEELVFRGYLLTLFLKKYSEIFSVLVVSSFWTIIHIPISYFVWSMSPSQILIFLSLTFVYGIGASIIFLRTKNLLSSILLHLFWEWPVILFR